MNFPLHIRFVEGGAIDSRIIRWGTHSTWSHVELYDEERTFGAQLKGGVCWRSRYDPCYRNVKATHLITLDLSQREWDLVQWFISASDGKPYDWRAIVAYAAGNPRWMWRHRNWREEDSWFCSEWVSRLLEIIGRLRFLQPMPVTRIAPAHVWQFLTVVLEGQYDI